MYEARDYQVLVRMANFAVAESGRTVDWLHLAGPRYLRSEDQFLLPPAGRPRTRNRARVPRNRAPLDGFAGLRRRHRPRPASWTTSASRCTAASAPAGTGRRRDDARALRGHSLARVSIRTSGISSTSGFSNTAAPHIAISVRPGPRCDGQWSCQCVADWRHRQRAARLEGTLTRDIAAGGICSCSAVHRKVLDIVIPTPEDELQQVNDVDREVQPQRLRPGASPACTRARPHAAGGVVEAPHRSRRLRACPRANTTESEAKPRRRHSAARRSEVPARGARRRARCQGTCTRSRSTASGGWVTSRRPTSHLRPGSRRLPYVALERDQRRNAQHRPAAARSG